MAALEHTQGRPTDPARHPLLRHRQGDPVIPSAADENRAADPVEALPGIVCATRLEKTVYSYVVVRFASERIILPGNEEFFHSARIVRRPGCIAPLVGNRDHK